MVVPSTTTRSGPSVSGRISHSPRRLAEGLFKTPRVRGNHLVWLQPTSTRRPCVGHFLAVSVVLILWQARRRTPKGDGECLGKAIQDIDGRVFLPSFEASAVDHWPRNPGGCGFARHGREEGAKIAPACRRGRGGSENEGAKQDRSRPQWRILPRRPIWHHRTGKGEMARIFLGGRHRPC